MQNHGDANKYRVHEGYPKVTVNDSDRDQVILIFDDYASKDSELTAITQYVYAHVLAEQKEIADAFLGIAIVEMSHLDMLADVIKDADYNPKFRDSYNEVWNSNFVPYGRSTKDRLEIAIQSEIGAIEQYEYQTRVINNESLVSLLKRIILDEELHIEIFKKLLKKYYGCDCKDDHKDC